MVTSVSKVIFFNETCSNYIPCTLKSSMVTSVTKTIFFNETSYDYISCTLKSNKLIRTVVVIKVDNLYNKDCLHLQPIK